MKITIGTEKGPYPDYQTISVVLPICFATLLVEYRLGQPKP